MKRALLMLMLALTAAPLAGCVIRPVRPYAAAVWVPGHYGPNGYWNRGSWR